MSARETAYATLGLPSSASIFEVRERFQELAKVYHPDASGNSASTAEFQKVASAYNAINSGDFSEFEDVHQGTSYGPQQRSSNTGWSFFGFKFRRQGDPIVLMRTYFKFLAVRLSLGIILANIVILIAYIAITRDSSPFTIIWGLMLPSNILEHVIPYGLAFDWTIALWFSYLYWIARYRMETGASSSGSSGPHWDRWDEEFDKA